MKRMKRLIPCFALVLLFGVLFSACSLLPSETPENAKQTTGNGGKTEMTTASTTAAHVHEFGEWAETDAATITPAANPVKARDTPRESDPRRKNVQAAPAAVPRKGSRSPGSVCTIFSFAFPFSFRHFQDMKRGANARKKRTSGAEGPARSVV